MSGNELVQPELTRLLQQWRDGDRESGDRAIALVYDELRRLAGYYMQGERATASLQPTALVNELYLKLIRGGPVDWQSRSHFMAVAARQLRRILVDHARKAQRTPGSAPAKVTVDPEHGWSEPRSEDILALEQAMVGLEALDSRSSQIVELRFFGGLNEEETAQYLGISLASVKRDWSFARAWLLTQLGGA
jgi:RNA polymerase sigma factor (TIGR02999 family)